MKPNLDEWTFVALVVDGEQLVSDSEGNLRGKADIYMRQAGDAAFRSGVAAATQSTAPNFKSTSTLHM